MTPAAALSARRRPTLSQLHHFVQQVQRAAAGDFQASASSPSLPSLLRSSASFLSSFLPPRLSQYHHLHHYHRYSPAITSLPSFSSLSRCCHRLSRADEWTRTAEGAEPVAAISSFAGWARASMEEMEEAVRGVTLELREVVRREGGEAQQAGVDALLSNTYALLIELRLHMSHHHYAYETWRLQQEGRLTGRADAERLAHDFPVVGRCDLMQVAHQSVETARAACIEKFGDAPEVQLRTAEGTAGAVRQHPHHPPPPPPQQQAVSILAVAAHLEFVLVELLKNGMKATMDRFGVLQLHSAPPITVTLSSSAAMRLPSSAPSSPASPPTVGVLLSDCGVGLSSLSPASAQSPCPQSLFGFFASSSSLPGADAGGESAADWRYSRSFGSPFAGQGVGLPLCRLYSETVYGGGLAVCWLPGLTQAFVVWQQHGQVELGKKDW